MCTDVNTCTGAGSYKVSGGQLIRTQFWALWVKRFHNVRRSKKGFVSEVGQFYVCSILLWYVIYILYTSQAGCDVRLTMWRTIKQCLCCNDNIKISLCVTGNCMALSMNGIRRENAHIINYLPIHVGGLIPYVPHWTHHLIPYVPHSPPPPSPPPQVILPAVFICLAMLVAKLNPPIPQMPPLELHPWVLTPTKFEDPHLTWFYRWVLPTVSLSPHHHH